jgi:hypothetical protein
LRRDRPEQRHNHQPTVEDDVMNGNTNGKRGSRRAGILAVMTGAAVLSAACGGSPPAPPAAGGSARYQEALAYSQCMRGHGVPNFPDPDAAGNIIQHVAAGQPTGNGPREQAADKTCHHLLPGGGAGNPGTQRRVVAQLLKMASCMRAHGEPDFPDPTVSSAPASGSTVSLPGGITLGLGAAGIDIRSPRFQAAEHACRSLIPAHLSFSAG